MYVQCRATISCTLLFKCTQQSTSPGAPPTDNHVSVHRQRKYPFLRRGEGIARFGMKKIKLKPKKSPKASSKPPAPSSSSNQKSPPKLSKPLSSVHSQKSPPKRTLSLPSSSEQYDRGATHGKCDGSQPPPPLLQSDWLPKVRKVARGKSEDASTQSLQVCRLIFIRYVCVVRSCSSARAPRELL